MHYCLFVQMRPLQTSWVFLRNEHIQIHHAYASFPVLLLYT